MGSLNWECTAQERQYTVSCAFNWIMITCTCEYGCNVNPPLVLSTMITSCLVSKWHHAHSLCDKNRHGGGVALFISENWNSKWKYVPLRLFTCEQC